MGAARPDARPLVRFASWARSRVFRFLSPAERDTLAQLAVHANASDGAAYPAIRTMARNVRRSAGTIMDALDGLATGGLTSAQGRLQQAGRRGRRPMVWVINEPPASAEALEAVIRAVQAYRAAVRVRKGREIVRPARTNRGFRDRRGRFSISPSPTDEEPPLLSIPHGVASLPVGDGQNSRNSPPPEPARSGVVGGGPPRPPRSATATRRSHGTTAKGGRGHAALRDAAALATELLHVAPEEWASYLAALREQGYAEPLLEEARRLAEALRPAWPLGSADGASSAGARVPSETSGSGSGGEGGAPLDRCVVSVEHGTGESAFIHPGVLSEVTKFGIWTPALRAAFLRDVRPPGSRFASPEQADRPVRREAR